MPVPLEQMIEELRKAEQATDLLTELERRLSAGNTDLGSLLTQLEQLGRSLPEADVCHAAQKSSLTLDIVAAYKKTALPR